jgi:hypothetical protein
VSRRSSAHHRQRQRDVERRAGLGPALRP